MDLKIAEEELKCRRITSMKKMEAEHLTFHLLGKLKFTTIQSFHIIKME